MIDRDREEIPRSHQKWLVDEARAEKISLEPYREKCFCQAPLAVGAWLLRTAKNRLTRKKTQP